MTKKGVVFHLTSVHARHDTRIFLKQCQSLASAGYQVTLLVADGKGDEIKDKVKIEDVGLARGRIDRIYNVTRRIYRRAVQADADVYHLHDPELLPIGLKLRRLGKVVIFDSHEDIPKQILTKSYLNPYLRIPFSNAYRLFEKYACRRLSCIVGATPSINNKFLLLNCHSVNVNNYPILEEFVSVIDVDWQDKKAQVCYVGGITRIRGIYELMETLTLLKSEGRLQLVGNFSEPSVEKYVKLSSGWKNRVDDLGWLNREQVAEVFKSSVAGLVTFLPSPNHIDAQPNKMFEYMSAGIPVVASNFSLWREIVEDNDCGLCVDPLSPHEIADAIDFLIRNPERAREMGLNGQRAIEEKYNWSQEEKKLLALYATLLDKENIK